MPGEGKLIVLEGPDDAVIEAQMRRLVRWLRGQGIAVEQTGEPTYGPVGAQIRLFQQGRLQIDPHSLALLWTADRMDHLGREDGILSWLADGRHVLCARYLLFSYACQLDHVELDWLKRINARCRHPDLTLFLDVDPAQRTRSSNPYEGSGEPEVRSNLRKGEKEKLRQNYWTIMDTLQRERGDAIWPSPIVIVDLAAPGVVASTVTVSVDESAELVPSETCRRQVAELLGL